jgi:hypothetical protein
LTYSKTRALRGACVRLDSASRRIVTLFSW